MVVACVGHDCIWLPCRPYGVQCTVNCACSQVCQPLIYSTMCDIKGITHYQPILYIHGGWAIVAT